MRHYAQRLLNPFRGVMNIIEFEAAEAVTTDGIHWDIYVRDAELVEDLPNSSRVQTSDIRYGSWSAQQGLKRGAIYPSDDFMFLEHQGAIVYQHLLKLHQTIPFTLQDHYELWLLDQDDRPLALIASATRADHLELDHALDWRAGLECRNYFSSDVYDQRLAQDNLSAGTYLTRYINQRCGRVPKAQWFLRRADGGGEGLQGIGIPPSMPGRQLNDECFHPLMLNADDHDESHGELIRQFFNWQAPWLLLLQHLPDEQRSHFEQQAKKRALTVAQQHLLYPQIIDPAHINAARVEARLRAAGASDKTTDDVVPTYYIELCPDPTLES